MGKDLFNDIEESRELFKRANDILNFNITELMFDGTNEDLLQTKVTQPAIFIHSVILALTSKTFKSEGSNMNIFNEKNNFSISLFSIYTFLLFSRYK